MLNTYFDNAATSWPKAPGVAQAVAACIENGRGNPGRSICSPVGGVVSETRAAVAALFHVVDPARVIFTSSATEATNMAIRGLLRPGDRVVTSSMEHNAVRRPLSVLKASRLIELVKVVAGSDGTIDPDDLRRVLGRKTRLVVLTHGSNVVGSVNNLRLLGGLVRESGAIFMVDASQTAGVVEINVEHDMVDILACSGHKGLLGPTGTGICYLSPRVGVLQPLLYGGTGSHSHLARMPPFLPDRFEAGTPNVHGLAGLQASIKYLMERGMACIARREDELANRMCTGLLSIGGLRLHGPGVGQARVPVFSVTHSRHGPLLIGQRLWEDFGVVTRAGLHCAPWAHKTFGTFPEGTLRLSPGLFHADADVDRAVESLRKVVSHLDRRQAK